MLQLQSFTGEITTRSGCLFWRSTNRARFASDSSGDPDKLLSLTVLDNCGNLETGTRRPTVHSRT